MPLIIKKQENPFDSSLDSYERLRVSLPFLIFDCNFTNGQPTLYNKGQKYHNEKINGTASILFENGYLNMNTLATGDKAIIATKLAMPTQQGKGKTICISGVLNTTVGGTEGVITRIGIFDDKNDKTVGQIIGNGHFFELNGNNLYVVERNTDTEGGTQTDTKIIQTDWNIDKFDGTGPSGKILDSMDTGKIFVIDVLWMGMGRVRMGFYFSGHLYYCHEFNRYTNSIVLINRKPSLPVRMDIESVSSNVSTTARLFSYCIANEGGELNLLGSKNSVLRESLTVGNTNQEACITFRLKAEGNRITTFTTFIEILDEEIDGAFIWKLWAFTALAITPTFTSVFNSCMEVDITTTANTILGGLPIEVGMGKKYTRCEFSPVKNYNGAISSDIEGNSIIYCLSVKSLNGSTSKIHAALGWREFD